MTVVTPSGPFSLGVDAIRDIFAGLAVFQTWCGLTPPNVAGAKARIFLGFVPESISVATGGFVVMDDFRFMADYASGGMGPHLTDEASVSLTFFEKAVPGATGEDTELNNPTQTILNSMGDIRKALETALSSGAETLDIRVAGVEEFSAFRRENKDNVYTARMKIERGAA